MTIAALLLGRKGSVGFPGKNTYPLLGRPLMTYPVMAAKKSRYVDKLYISTDDEVIMEIGRKHGAEIIIRPPELCTKAALGRTHMCMVITSFVNSWKLKVNRLK